MNVVGLIGMVWIEEFSGEGPGVPSSGGPSSMLIGLEVHGQIVLKAEHDFLM